MTSRRSPSRPVSHSDVIGGRITSRCTKDLRSTSPAGPSIWPPGSSADRSSAASSANTGERPNRAQSGSSAAVSEFWHGTGVRQAGHAASMARPWPSAESRRCTPTATTVHTDRRNCAHRPSLQRGRPSAMRPWTAQYDGLQRDKVTHAGTEKKRPASARICS
jgi:hypothetical protein